MDTKRRILILISIPNFDYTNEKSAVLSYLNSIKSAFENNGHEVEYAFNKVENQQNNENKISNTKPSKLKSQFKSLLKSWPGLYYSLVFLKYFNEQDHVFKLLSKRKAFDLIVEFHTVGSTVGVKLARLWNAKYSVIFDSPTDEQFLEMHGTKSVFWRKIKNAERYSLEGADRIMVYSPACKEYLEKEYDIKGIISVTPSLLNKPTDYKRKETPDFNIGFIGSFLSWHKVDMLVKVFAEFHLLHPEARLILIGYGQEWENIKKLIIELDLENDIEIPGFVSEEELIGYKNRFSIAVMPGSNWYGSPLKLFEYAQAGIPFVAPVSKTVSSIFRDGEHCIFVKSQDEEKSLFEALELYYYDENLRKYLGMNAMRYVEKEFNKDAYSAKLIESLA